MGTAKTGSVSNSRPMTTKENDGGGLARLQDELAGIAREIAAVLMAKPVDTSALAHLDQRADLLREQVRAAYPPECASDHGLIQGSRLLPSGG